MSEPIEVTDEMKDHPLYPIFMQAIRQAMFGKGERHGGARTPFLEQPWVHYAKLHGRGFLTGQAAKKLEEAASTRTGQGFETEALGAMVYLGMSVLKEREDQQKREAAAVGGAGNSSSQQMYPGQQQIVGFHVSLGGPRGA